jgi:hypothetical protein
MAEDLVKERRRVVELRMENRRLRAELERLQNAHAASGETAGREPGPRADQEGTACSGRDSS